MTGIILPGDCLETLQNPPRVQRPVLCDIAAYYGLRDYGTAQWEGGDPECDHINLGSAQMGRMDSHSPDQPSRQNTTKPYRAFCGKCGAVRVDDQIGLEETPEQYVEKLVQVFREVRRVLKDAGRYG